MVKTTAGWRASAHRRYRECDAVGDAGLHDRDGERQAGGAAQYFPPARQQYGGGVGCGRRRNWRRLRKTLPAGVKLQTFYDQSTLVRDSIASVRDAILIGLVLAAIILVLFLRDWGSSLVAGLVIPATIAITLIALRALGPELQPDDAGRAGGGGWAGDRRRDRGGGEHRAASRLGAEPRARRSAARCARFACRWWDRRSRPSWCFCR